MEKDLWGNEIIKDVLLRDKFIEPPFSVLDTKKGEWQTRKKLWIAKGIKSEIGRGDHVNYNGRSLSESQMRLNKFEKKINTKGKSFHEHKCDYMPKMKSNTSIFDPALTELMYKWFCPKNGSILDPFAGGSVRGIVANYLKYNYTGIELRTEQVEANEKNASEILKEKNIPKWIVGDSDEVLDSIDDRFDFLFSCPPYMDLEIYSDDKNDLSNMSDENFIIKYESIIKKSCDKLKTGSFACFVVGEVRDKKTGFYKDFVGITKQAFLKNDVGLYNDVVLLDPIGTAMLRANNNFIKGHKKLVKIHQNVLVFKKG